MPNTPDYDDLCYAVKQIDPEAAAYMRRPSTRRRHGFKAVGDLGYCFYWGNTPQGFEYWESLILN